MRVKDPQSTAERCWNRAENVLSPVVLVTPIVLKLTGVITWSWWWVLLSPLWISAGLLALAITVLAILPFKGAKPWLASASAVSDPDGSGKRRARP
jgi:hypothetical protein